MNVVWALKELCILIGQELLSITQSRLILDNRILQSV